MVVRELYATEAAIYRASVADRRQRDIDPKHWHWKVYVAWLRAKRPRQEPQVNWCHYWRVVFLFALPRVTWDKLLRPWAVPLWDKVPLKRISLSLLLLWALYMVVAILIAYSFARSIALIIVIGSVYVPGLCVTTQYILHRINNDLWRGRSFDLDRKPGWMRITAYVLFGVPALILIAVGYVATKTLDGIVWLVEDFYLLAATKCERGTKRLVRALDAHPANRPRFRAWTVMLLGGGTSLLLPALHGTEPPSALTPWLATMTLISALFALGHIIRLLFARLRQLDLQERAQLFGIIGFRKWLWEGNGGYEAEFRMVYGRQLTANATAEQHAAVVPWKDLLNYMEGFVKYYPVPRSQLELLPREIRTAAHIQLELPQSNTWQHIKLFGSGTWALIRLMWAGLVYFKRVGACPIMRVKKNATNELVTS